MSEDKDKDRDRRMREPEIGTAGADASEATGQMPVGPPQPPEEPGKAHRSVAGTRKQTGAGDKG